MIHEVKMPQITMQVRAARLTMDAGYVLAWLVRAGEAVKKGDPLAEIEEEKAVEVLESPADGVVAEICCETGVRVEAGEVLCRIEA